MSLGRNLHYTPISGFFSFSFFLFFWGCKIAAADHLVVIDYLLLEARLNF
jgi:hypothetical protein